MTELVARPGPTAWLRQWRDKGVIKVVTGVRRCGKSTLLRLWQDELRADGVPQERIVTFNLEDPGYGPLLTDYVALYERIKAQVQAEGRTYVLIDEIQNADQFERVVDGLFILDGVDLYLTGSSSSLLSGALATLLTGRYVEKRLLPLSFAEFVSAKAPQDPEPPLLDLYDAYTRLGGFPFVKDLEDDDQVRQYLEGIASTVLLKDVATAQRVGNTAQLRSVTEFVFANIGNLTSIKRIADAMTSAGRPISRQTVESYLTGLTDAFLVYPAPRWDIRGKRLLESGEKHYVVDTGLRRALLGARPIDAGHLLENIVYLELLRRPGRVFTGKIGTNEVDFVVEDHRGTTYIQVALNVDDPATLERELAPLRAIPGYEPRHLLTLDRHSPQSYDGIRRESVLDWLLAD
ncbi:MAG: ATP-binding protein [Bifidobacteriaceae bacterium]|jgi:predicted AAA+ superfamily ATPase|nr:ATP-binding protein [Bifidobacteriaceae bacterium]